MTKDIRTRILDAAVHLLETEGAKSFGQTRVARAAGVKQGNITYHFPKKSDLVAAVVDRVNAHRTLELEQLGELARTLEPEQARALLVDLFPSFVMDTKRARVMLALLIEAERDPTIASQLSAVNDKQRAALGALLSRTADDVDLELVLATVSGLSLIYSRSGLEHQARITALLRRFGQWLPMLLQAAPAGQAASAAPGEQAAPVTKVAPVEPPAAKSAAPRRTARRSPARPEAAPLGPGATKRVAKRARPSR